MFVDGDGQAGRERVADWNTNWALASAGDSSFGRGIAQERDMNDPRWFQALFDGEIDEEARAINEAERDLYVGISRRLITALRRLTALLRR